MTTRLFITLNRDERHALGLLAQQECRELKQQAIFIIRSELEKRKLLPDIVVVPQTQEEVVQDANNPG